MIYLKNKIVYHGSKEGIVGDIQPIGRPISDFGQGFYMGSKQEQTELLVLDEPSPTIYTLKLSLDRIPHEQILTFYDPQKWALFVAYNRNMLNKYAGIEQTALFKELIYMSKNKDIIIGPIADDNMTMLMEQFVDETITDRAFTECIKCIDLGTQYVAKTQRACRRISIINEQKLSIEKQDLYHKTEAERRRINNRTLKQTRKQYKREGLYLSEIIEQYEKQAKRMKMADKISGSPYQHKNKYDGIDGP